MAETARNLYLVPSFEEDLCPALPSPRMTSTLGLAPLVDHEVYGEDVTRIIDAYGSLYLQEIGKGAFVAFDGGKDPEGQRTEQYLQSQGLSLSAIKAVFLTHGHKDHVGLGHALDVPILGTAETLKVVRGETPSEGLLPGLPDKVLTAANTLLRRHRFYLSAELPSSRNLEVIKDGQIIKEFGKAAITAFATPGHTAGSSIYVTNAEGRKRAVVIAGDALDFRLDGSVKNAFWPVTENHTQSAQAIEAVVEQIDQEGYDITDVLPAHSGRGEYLAMRNYRADTSRLTRVLGVGRRIFIGEQPYQKPRAA